MERLFGADQGLDIAYRADIDLAARQECHGAIEIDGKAAFDPAKNNAFDAQAILVGLFELFPGFFTARALSAKNGFAAAIFNALNENLNLITNLEFVRLSGSGKFFQWHPPLNLEADIN